jgi:hypothetical protein
MNIKKEVFLYLERPQIQKTSDLAEQHFSRQSWLFKHRFLCLARKRLEDAKNKYPKEKKIREVMGNPR